MSINIEVSITVMGLPRGECFVATKTVGFANCPSIGDRLADIPGLRGYFLSVNDVSHSLLIEGDLKIGSSHCVFSGNTDEGKAIQEAFADRGWKIRPWD